MKKEEAEFIIETLETAIDWAEYATPYFQEKHNLAKDKEDVQKAIKLLRAATLENKICENCKFYQPLIKQDTLFKRCFFLGTVGDIITCGRWEQR